jgi:tetratricopeptide (TPR) repeat protein
LPRALQSQRTQAISAANRAVTEGDYDRAIADYNEAIRLDPKDVNAYIYRGFAYGAKGDHYRAVTDYSEAIRLGPNTSAYNNRGNLYRSKGDCDRAIADLTEAIRLDRSIRDTA